MIDIDASIDAMTGDEAKTVLKRLLRAQTMPAFGALPKREMDLVMFCEMSAIGIVPSNASLYDLMTGLRITRSKASQLIFDREVRRGSSAADLDSLAIEAITNARFVKDGEFFQIEEENPLLHAHIKERLKRLRHLSDTSFNSAIIRMTLPAATALMVDLIPTGRRDDVKKALVEAGAPDKAIGHVVGTALKKLGGKAMDTATDVATDGLKEYLKPILMGTPAAIIAAWPAIF